MDYAVDIMGSNDWGDGPIHDTMYEFPTLDAAVRHANREMERAADGRDLFVGLSIAAGHDVLTSDADIWIGAYIYGEPDESDPASEGAQWTLTWERPGDIYPMNPEAEQHVAA